MNLLNEIIETGFRHGNNGKEVFMPWSHKGTAYIIENRHQGIEMRSLCRQFLVVVFSLALANLIGPLLLGGKNMIFLILFTLGVLAWQFLLFRRAVSSLKKTILHCNFEDHFDQ